MNVAVIGAGMCGLAAAWCLDKVGAQVTLISSGVGETDLSSGALDFAPWRAGRQSMAHQPSRDALDFLRELALFAYQPGRSVTVATRAGILRPAHGVVHGVLDISAHRGECVLVADVGRADFNAEWLARSLSEDPWALATRTRFLPAKVPHFFLEGELDYPSSALCAIDYADARLTALRVRIAELKRIHPEARALLFGPWLGTALDRSAWLGTGLEIGETLHTPEGPFGDRFDRARGALLARSNITRIERRVARVGVGDAAVHLELETFDAPERQSYEHVVVATGGLVGGGAVLREVQIGSHHGFSLGDALSTTHPIDGDLAGWDPNRAPHTWLYAEAPEGHHARNGRAYASRYVGTSTLGAAIERGCALARALEKDQHG